MLTFKKAGRTDLKNWWSIKIDELIQNNNLIFNHKVKSNPYVDKDIQCREDECSK